MTFVVKKQPWYIYLVGCNDGSLYCGATSDLDRRVSAHNAGKGAKYTKARRPVILVYSERFPDKSSALKRERTIKKLSRVQKLNLVRNHGLL